MTTTSYVAHLFWGASLKGGRSSREINVDVSGLHRRYDLLFERDVALPVSCVFLLAFDCKNVPRTISYVPLRAAPI